jgi:selenium metabolism protein YedF
MKIIDTKGQLCPAPLIAARRALKEAKPGESFTVLTDNRTSFNNLSRFLNDNHTAFSVREGDGIWTLEITKREREINKADPAEYCDRGIPHFKKGDFIIAFSSDRMGSGDDELGSRLMINFVKAIRDLDVLPRRLVFYNSGVILGSSGSPVIDSLKEIERMGVDIFLCATCVQHYSLEEVIDVGTMSNMFEIAQFMSSASSVIRP